MRTFFILIFSFSVLCHAQEKDSLSHERKLDLEYIHQVENPKNHLPKVLHAEPLYIDLIRDLGARKGEKEWNVGFGITDKNNYDKYEGLVEYEWAPIDRLGLEVEIPFSIYSRNNDSFKPDNAINSLKMAAQYTFLVNEEKSTSLALGYIHEFELNTFNNMKNERFFTGNVFNPFFVAAKRWGNNFHTLLYTGPVIEQHFSDQSWHHTLQVNSNVHYMISGTRNFIGVEFNKEFYRNNFDMVIRPQMRLVVNNEIMLGIVTGIPVSKHNERFSSFLRLIYEPPHR